MSSCCAARRAWCAILVAFLGQPLGLAAQTQSPGPAQGNQHARFTAARPGTAADTARALAVVQRLREAIAPYADLEKAVAAGYRPNPMAEMQPGKRLVHMGNPALRRSRNSDFDPARPQALLYRRAHSGELTLAGAMYTAPGNLSVEELDARIPLSVARWHRHLNKAGGRFRSESPRYMVHVMTDAGEDLGRVFPQGKEHRTTGHH